MREYEAPNMGRKPAPGPVPGSIEHAIAMIVSAVRQLPSKGSRTQALGQALTQLVEEHTMDGLNGPVSLAMHLINRYSHPFE